MIEDSRIQSYKIHDKNRQGRYIVYWMQQSQRTSYNHALEFAIQKSNEQQLPLLVYFGLTDKYPEANERHYYFMLEGLKDVSEELKARNIGFIMLKESPQEGLKYLLEDAKTLIMDMGYMKIQRNWRREIISYCKEISLDSYIIESDVIVPVKQASDKEEIGARTLRKKIQRQLDDYLNELNHQEIKIKWNEKYQALVEDIVEKSTKKALRKIEILNPLDDTLDIEKIINEMQIDKSVRRSPIYAGGQKKAKQTLDIFIKTKLPKYSLRNHPELDYCSDLSPYLHFGQISPLEIVLKVNESFKQNIIDIESYESFLEELIVRRELAINFVYYNQAYDEFEEMTYNWAYTSMDQHKEDIREYEYSLEEIENYKTHDRYFNAAMKEMVITGKMHTYMRMYWCKKIIEWVSPYKNAYQMSIYLNNKYFIDGRDPNSYTGVSWCFGKHDRAWKEREIFGKLRYMNANGLKRKFDIESYVEKVDRLSQ